MKSSADLVMPSKPTLTPKWTATNASVDNGATTYTVQAGNTLGQIVADYNKKNPGANLKWQDVAKWSGITDASKMRIGHVINFTDPAASQIETEAEDVDVKDGGVKVEDPADSLGLKTPSDSLGVKAPADSLGSALDSLKLNMVKDSTGVVAADSTATQ